MGLSVCRAPLPYARLQEVGGGRQRGQEDPFQISPSSRLCQRSHLRTKYLLHQRVPFCEWKRTEWAWMNRLKTNPFGPTCRPLSALSHPAQSMIPENWYSWYTYLTHVSRTAKYNINYILQGLLIGIIASWKGTLHGILPWPGFNSLFHTVEIQIVRIIHTNTHTHTQIPV